MTQAIPVFIVNLARRPDRLARLGGRLDALGIAWQRTDALDALQADKADLDAVISRDGPLGRLGDGDRACMVSHMRAWQQFLSGDAPFALILEDDVYLADDARALLATAEWIPPGIEAVKLEKFGEGGSTVLLGPPLATVPGSGRVLRRLYSRHVGGAAYLVSRRAAEAGLALRGSLRVPVDHLLFNPNVSPLARMLQPAVVDPALATQRRYGYNSDVAALGKAVRPKGWRKRWRSMKRGFYDVRLLPRQLLLVLGGRARLIRFEYGEGDRPAGRTP